MAAKTDWGTLFFAIATGIGLGISCAFLAVWIGLPTIYVGPVTGGVVGALMPLIIRLRAPKGAGGRH